MVKGWSCEVTGVIQKYGGMGVDGHCRLFGLVLRRQMGGEGVSDGSRDEI
jgi:hypothetical protein